MLQRGESWDGRSSRRPGLHNLWFIGEVRTLDALNALAWDFPGINPVSQRICFPNAVLATMESSGETESNSAGTQLGKGYIARVRKWHLLYQPESPAR